MTSSWAARGATIVADLPHNAVVVATGDDAPQFLHGQFTNDVAALDEGAAQWSGWCTPKGRLVASFLLVRLRGAFVTTLLPGDIAPAFQKRLSMYVLRSKVKLANETEERLAIGLAGKQAAEIVRTHYGSIPEPMRLVEAPESMVIRLDDERFVILAPRAKADELRRALAERGAERADSEAWEWASIRAGIPTIVAQTQEAFVPQMVNFDLIGGVSFHKGCYPGQEIVARTQYRGILKRRMALAHLDAAECPQPGDSVYSAAFGEQAAGSIANSARSPDGGCDMLVVAQIESLASGELRWKSPEGPPLLIVSRPYAQATELAS